MSHLSDPLIHVCPVCKSNLFRIFLEDSDSNRINIIEKIQNLLLLSWSKHLKVSSMFLPESIKSLDGNGLSKVINVMQSNNLFV